MLKIPAVYGRDISTAKLTHFSRQFLPASLLDFSAGFFQRSVVDESGMIRI
jgi:hypothetical protein